MVVVVVVVVVAVVVVVYSAADSVATPAFLLSLSPLKQMLEFLSRLTAVAVLMQADSYHRSHAG